MKIGLVSSHPFYFPGGVQEQVKGLYKYLKSKGYYVKVLAPRHLKRENYGKDFLLFGNDIPFPMNESTGTISFCFNLPKLQKAMEKENFDLLHVHNIGFFTPLQILGLSKGKNVLTLHTLPAESPVDKFTLDLIKIWAKNNLGERFDSLIATSKPVYDYAKDAYDGPKYIIPNGIDLKRFSPKNKKIDKFVDGRVNILFVGRFDERKGLDYLIDAFEILKKRHRNIQLIIVGGGSRKPFYEELVKEKRLDDVVFTGYVSDEDLPRYYATCDIFCSPAIHGEGFGVVLQEAMATGKPVVGFANAGYKQVITGDAKRFLVKPKDLDGLVKSIETFIEDENLRKKFGKWGLKEVKKYSWENVGKQNLKVYKSLV